MIARLVVWHERHGQRTLAFWHVHKWITLDAYATYGDMCPGVLHPVMDPIDSLTYSRKHNVLALRGPYIPQHLI